MPPRRQRQRTSSTACTTAGRAARGGPGSAWSGRGPPAPAARWSAGLAAIGVTAHRAGLPSRAAGRPAVLGGGPRPGQRGRDRFRRRSCSQHGHGPGCPLSGRAAAVRVVAGSAPGRAAARVERAPGRRVAQVGRRARDAGHRPSVGPCSGGNELSRPRVYGCRGARKSRRRVRPLDQPPGVHDRDRVGDLHQQRQVVRDEQDGEAELGRAAGSAPRGSPAGSPRPARWSARP